MPAILVEDVPDAIAIYDQLLNLKVLRWAGQGEPRPRIDTAPRKDEAGRWVRPPPDLAGRLSRVEDATRAFHLDAHVERDIDIQFQDYDEDSFHFLNAPVDGGKRNSVWPSWQWTTPGAEIRYAVDIEWALEDIEDYEDEETRQYFRTRLEPYMHAAVDSWGFTADTWNARHLQFLAEIMEERAANFSGPPIASLRLQTAAIGSAALLPALTRIAPLLTSISIHIDLRMPNDFHRNAETTPLWQVGTELNVSWTIYAVLWLTLDRNGATLEDMGPPINWASRRSSLWTGLSARTIYLDILVPADTDIHVPDDMVVRYIRPKLLPVAEMLAYAAADNAALKCLRSGDRTRFPDDRIKLQGLAFDIVEEVFAATKSRSSDHTDDGVGG